MPKEHITFESTGYPDYVYEFLGSLEWMKIHLLIPHKIRGIVMSSAKDSQWYLPTITLQTSHDDMHYEDVLDPDGNLKVY